MDATEHSGWTVIPGSERDIEKLRQQCRRMVRRRAALSAGVSAVPIPGVDLVSDLSLFARLVDDVNQAFGLSAQQIGRLQPKFRLIACEAAVGVGAMMVGRMVTRQVVVQLFKRAGGKMAAKTAAKMVPIAGQLVSAAIGFTVFRTLGYQHVEACVAAASKMAVLRPA